MKSALKSNTFPGDKDGDGDDEDIMMVVMIMIMMRATIATYLNFSQ